MMNVTDDMVEAACDAYNKNYHPMDWRKTMRASLEAALASPVGQIAEGEAQAMTVDEIVTALYRRFKAWSKRGFGPDDVTWCEVKADVLSLVAALAPVGQAEGRPVCNCPSLDNCDGSCAPYLGGAEAEPVAWRVRSSNFPDEYFGSEAEADQWANSPGVFDSGVAPLYALSAAPAPPATGWQKHYDRPEHLALDLRQIADNADHRAGFATMDGQILRRAAACFDRLPEDIDLREAREAVRSLPTPPNGGAE